MFTPLINRVDQRTSALYRFLSLCDVSDKAAANPGSQIHTELFRCAALVSNSREDRIFRHCAAVTQLYSIYESFCESALNIWLTRLPRYESLSDLPPTFGNAYRHGIGRIIQECNKRKYRHLNLVDILDKYLSALRGESPWEFIGEALIAHERNLRRAEFEHLFHSAGLNGVWTALEKNQVISQLTNEADKTLEQIILDLVTYRNDASHGSPDEILGIDTLRSWITFIKAFCGALATFIIHCIVNQEATHFPKSVLGNVTETFNNNISILSCNCGVIKVGDWLYFLRPSDCIYARVDSLQLNDVDRRRIDIHENGLEVGIKTNIKVPRGSRAIIIENPKQ